MERQHERAPLHPSACTRSLCSHEPRPCSLADVIRCNCALVFFQYVCTQTNTNYSFPNLMEVRMGLGRFSDGSEVRIHVPVRETRVRALIQEDPTSRAAI